jgi:hypothetical protein
MYDTQRKVKGTKPKKCPKKPKLKKKTTTCVILLRFVFLFRPIFRAKKKKKPILCGHLKNNDPV